MAGAHTEHRIWTDLAFDSKAERLTVDFEIQFRIAPSGRQEVQEVTPRVTLAASPGEAYAAPSLGFDQRVPVHHRFRTGYILEGWLEWQDRLVTAERYQVISRLSLQSPSTHETWTYEGFMVQFGERLPVPPPPPPPHRPMIGPLPPPEAQVGVQQVDLNMHELFPFIYLSPWPQVPEADRKAAFIEIPKGVTDGNRFWSDLVQARSVKNVADMRDLSVRFIEGDRFMGSVSALPPPYHAYPRILCKLRHSPRPDFAELSAQVAEVFGSWKDLETALATSEARAGLQDLWNTVLALLVMLGARHALLADLIRVLIAAHVLNTALPYGTALPKPPPEADPEDDSETPQSPRPEPPLPLGPGAAQIRVWLGATLVAPGAVFPLPGPERTPRGAASDGWVRPYAIGRVRSVQYQPAGYSLGEVQRIENILRGEVRERSSRNLTLAEREEGQTRADLTRDGRDEDTTSTDLIKQIRKTLSDKLSTTAIDRYDARYGAPSENDVSISGKWWVQEHPAGGYLQDSSSFARDVVEKTLRRIEQRVHDQRSTRHVEEHESRDTSRFENLSGQEDIRGIYRWVNRSYRVIPRDLGDRLVMEIMLDDPAEFLLENLQKYTVLTLTPPKSPEESGIQGFRSLLPEQPAAPPGTRAANENPADKHKGRYYLDAFAQFGVTEQMPPPPQSVTVSRGLKSRNPVCETTLAVPDGYLPDRAWATVVSFSEDVTTEVFVGATRLTLGEDAQDGRTTVAGDLPGGKSVSAEDGTRRLWVAVLCKPKASGAKDAVRAPAPAKEEPPQPAPDDSAAEGTDAFTTCFVANIEVECDCSDAHKAEWQYRAYQAVQAGYRRQLEAYHAQLERQRDAILRENPEVLQTTINAQIVQGCLAELYAAYLRQTDPGDGAAQVPGQIRIGEPRVFQFLRNALAWGDLDCQIYLDGDDMQDKWHREGESALLDMLSPDLRFRNFLRAGRARILVPAQPRLTRSVLYFLGTGQIWPDSDDLAPCLEGDVDILARLKAEEAQAVPPARSESWVIHVPTAMTVLSNEPFLPDLKGEPAR